MLTVDRAGQWQRDRGHAGAAGEDEIRVAIGDLERQFTPKSARRLRLIPLLMGLAGAGALALLVAEFRTVDLRQLISSLNWGWLSLALASTTVSLFAAVHNLHGFAPRRLRTRSTVLVQLAVSFTRVLTPSVVSTPLVATRYLNRAGLPMPVAIGTVGAAQTAQVVVTTLVVTILSLSTASSRSPAFATNPAMLGAPLVAVAMLAVGIAFGARRSAMIRRGLVAARGSLHTLVSHSRRHPGRFAGGLLASAALTLTHVLAFACCVLAVGGHGSLLSLTIVYLAASTAGSFIPTPGGAGAVEAALLGGLVATGVPMPIALAAAVLSRLESVWLPAIPGWFAMRSLRRSGLM